MTDIMVVVDRDQAVPVVSVEGPARTDKESRRMHVIPPAVSAQVPAVER